MFEKTYKFPMTLEYSAEDVINIIATFSNEDKQKVKDFLNNQKQQKLKRARAGLIIEDAKYIEYNKGEEDNE